jgi:DNA topoisomerase-1
MVKPTDAKNEADIKIDKAKTTSKSKVESEVKPEPKPKTTDKSKSKVDKSKVELEVTEVKPEPKPKSTTSKSKSKVESESLPSDSDKDTGKNKKTDIPECTTVYKGKHVVIVESPNKISKIKSLLEKIQDHPSFKDCKFIVTASYGHIREIDHKHVGIDINNNFKPAYLVSDSKTHVVWDLNEMTRDASIVWLAADDDREGEAIAWHLKDVLKLTDARYQRVTFNEITEKALRTAFLHPRKIDMDRFNSQQARAVIDKLIGYLISPILDAQFQAHGLSAGRVQSVAVDLVVQREKEIQKFESSGYFQVNGSFTPKSTDSELKKMVINADLDKTFVNQDEAQKFLDIANVAEFKILDITTTNTKRRPPPPLITSSLQQEASTKLGIAPADTMRIAQKLYETGFITYMRTDSVILSDDAKKQIKGHIKGSFGDNYHTDTSYANKGDSQEAHEACRPCDFSKKNVLSNGGLTARENKVYELIWKRAMGSQMAPAECEIKTIKIGMNNSDRIFITKAEKITFKGFLALYEKSKPKSKSADVAEDAEDVDETGGCNSDEESIVDQSELYDSLKKLEIGQILLYKLLEATEKYSKPPKGRFTEASLIKELERLKIGRPSTYASIITKIQDKKRGYVSKLDKKGEKKDVHILQYKGGKFNMKTTSITTGAAKQKLFPGQTGKSIVEFMKENFDKIMDYAFTANVETELDEIAQGKHIWYKVVQNIYDEFNPQIDKIIQKHKGGEKGKIKKFLGVDPKTKGEISLIHNYWGPSICLTTGPNKEDKKYVSLSQCEELDVTFETALELLKYPISYKNSDDVVEYELCKSSKNYYIKRLSDKKSVGVNDDEVDTITNMSYDKLKTYFDDCNQQSNDVVKEFDNDIKIRKSKFGDDKYYISYKGKVNVRIPAKIDYNTLTRDQCAVLINKKKEQNKTTGKTKLPKPTPKEEVKPKSTESTEPKAKTSKPKAPKAETPKAPKAETPKAPKAETSKPKAETPKAPKAETSKPKAKKTT